MAKKQEVNAPRKFVVVYDDEDHKSTWTYDYSKTRNGPVSVEIHYKNEPAKVKKTRKNKIKVSVASLKNK